MTEEEIAKVRAWAEEATGGPRTPRERAEERLHGWIELGWPDKDNPLGRQPWSGARNPVGPLPWPEIVCILAGLDPEGSASAEVEGWALLPGALDDYGGFDTFPRDERGRHVLHTLAEERIERLRGLHLKTMSAKGAIKAAVAANLSPPWLAAYLDGDHAKDLLNNYERADLRDQINKAEPEPLGKPKTVGDMASAGGRAKGRAQRAKFLPDVERLLKEGLTGVEIIARLAQEHGDSAPPQSTVYGWIKKQKQANAA